MQQKSYAYAGEGYHVNDIQYIEGPHFRYMTKSRQHAKP